MSWFGAMRGHIRLIIIAASAVACSPVSAGRPPDGYADQSTQALKAGLDTATFAGGCFWSMVHPFDQLAGVVRVTAGYTGGTLANPTYAAVSSEATGHREAVEVVYDPAKITFAELLESYWHSIDPLDPFGQACDRGYQYRTAIFYHGSEQERMADSSKAILERRFARPIATDIIAANPFYPAETYHQNYYLKNPIRYALYRSTCGRPQRLAELWGAGSDSGNVRAKGNRS